jgi:hypothetical protein
MLTVLQVGGVKFRAWPHNIVNELREHHANVAKWASISYRSAKNQVDGELRTIGSRVPMGGRPGDGYGPYAHMKVDTLDSISALFDTAKVCHLFHGSEINSYGHRILTHC